MRAEKYREPGIILGVRIDSKPLHRVLRSVRSRISERKKFYITTPNPEIIIKAQEDKDFLEILNSSDLSIPDGIGIAVANKFLSLPTPARLARKVLTFLAQGLGVGFSTIFDREWVIQDANIIRGRDLFMELIKLANKKRWKVFLLGDREGSAEKTKNQLALSYKSVKLFANPGPNLDEKAKPKTKTDKKIEKYAINKINEVKPQLLFVAFGAPKQEKWLAKHKNRLKFNGAMTVGGTFDYLTGKAKLPPKWIEDRGLEWFWRMVNEPNRVKRIFKAVAVFGFEVFLYKLGKKDSRYGS